MPELGDTAKEVLVATFAFLSDEWLAEAQVIRHEYKGEPPTPAQAIKMNLVVTDMPFGEPTTHAHLDTSSGEMEIELGHMPDAELKVTLDHATAKALLVELNLQAGLQAFMTGKIKVEGDMAKLMMLQATAAAPDPSAVAVAKRIQAMTE